MCDMDIGADYSDSAMDSGDFEACDAGEGLDSAEAESVTEFVDVDDDMAEVDLDGNEEVGENFEDVLEDVPSETELSFENAEVENDIEEMWQESTYVHEFEDETEESPEEGVKVLTREITQEVRESRLRDTEETLDNYRENLRDRGIDEQQIENFVAQEREKIYAEYESMDKGDTSSNIYYMPTDWDQVAESLRTEGYEETYEVKQAESVEEFVPSDEPRFIMDFPSETEDEDTSVEYGIEMPDKLPDDYEEVAVEEYELVDIRGEEIREEIEQDSEIGTEIALEDIEDETLEISEEIEDDGFITDVIEERETEDNVSEYFAEVPDAVIDETDEVVDSDVQDALEESLEAAEENEGMVEPELEVDYEQIYEEIQNDALEQGFADVNIDENQERLFDSLENFENTKWESFSLDEQKESIYDLSEYVKEVIGFDDPPKIEYYNNSRVGDYGQYDPRTNTLHINEYMLYDSAEAADTIAHELWHAHQYENANNPHNARDYQYRYNFENYVTPEDGFDEYQNQLVEAEARAFAAQIKERLDMSNRRVR